MALAASDGDGDGDPTSREAIARRLHEARRAKGMTQKEAAEQLGIYARRLSEWEGGQATPRQALPDLAKLYGVSVAWLLTGVETAESQLAELREQVTELRSQLTALAEQTAEGFSFLQKILTDPPRRPRR